MSPQHDPSQIENWESDPAGMMGYYQGMTYQLGQSIADLIDNCYDASASRIDVEVGIDENEEPYVRILDNGTGISAEGMRDAMRLGSQKPRKPSDLGVFGIGMKLSSLAQANEVTVASIHKDIFSLRRISASHIRGKNRNELLLFSTGSDVFNKSKQKMAEEGWSTMVLLEDIHAKQSFLTVNVDPLTALDIEIRKVGVHLGLTFHRIIQKYPDRELTFNGKPVTIRDPTMSWEDDSKFGTNITDDIVSVSIDGKTVNVPIKFIIVPHHKQRRKDKKMCDGLHRGYHKANAMQGFYLYRNDRLISYGQGWQGLFGDTIDEHNKYGKIVIEIPPSHSTFFGLDPTKTGITLPLEFLRQLKKRSEAPRRWGQIKRGAELSFRDAFNHRYRNEGMKSALNQKKPVPRGSSKGNAKSGSEGENSVPAPPGMEQGKRKRQIKPKPVVESIEEGDTRTTILLNPKKKGYDQLMEYIRKWRD